VSEPRPWRRAIGWLAVLGPFFFASYGFANWLASRREHVGAVAFPWERSIPFLPWTIVPYWSIDFLYAGSVFFCQTRRELDRHAQRLLLVQLISITFFIAFPLRFSFERPPTDGFFGSLFTALGSFDKPFNQAPSLHIALLVVIWVCLARHTPRRWRWLLHAWMSLIGISILTTYQHHFLDLPTGLLAGFAALWALPEDRPSPFAVATLASDPTRRTLAARYTLGALALAAFSYAGGAFLWLLWPATSLSVVALNYAVFGEAGFQKRDDGSLTHGAWGLLAPYFGAAWINSRIWTHKHSAPSHVADGVWIGRIPSSSELRQSSFAAVVDLAAELPCGAHDGLFYRSEPVLDLTAPNEEKLRRASAAIEEARARGPVLVCCALGYSRSAAAVIAWLLLTGRAPGVEAAMQLVASARPSIVLKREACATLEAFA
jgi:protein-tyrosine phosphatase/membrane-associated phospholipid phosphatase